MTNVVVRVRSRTKPNLDFCISKNDPDNTQLLYVTIKRFKGKKARAWAVMEITFVYQKLKASHDS